MLWGFIFQNKLQTINVTMNIFEWKQNEPKILAFVVCSPKFPKSTLNWRTCLNDIFWREFRMKKS